MICHAKLANATCATTVTMQAGSGGAIFILNGPPKTRAERGSRQNTVESDAASLSLTGMRLDGVGQLDMTNVTMKGNEVSMLVACLVVWQAASGSA